MRDNRIRILAELGLTIALFAILQYFNIKLPGITQGGSISLSMVPIVVLALLRGPVVGLICGALCGGIDMMIEPHIYGWWQPFMDYILAYSFVGAAGFFSAPVQKLLDKGKTVSSLSFIGLAAVLGPALRLIIHVLSGVLFFREYVPEGQNMWIYSIVYNASYMVPATIVTVLVAAVVVPVLYKALFIEQHQQ
jgi:thiamine transporter